MKQIVVGDSVSMQTKMSLLEFDIMRILTSRFENYNLISSVLYFDSTACFC